MTDDTFGDELIASLTEAVAHAEGKPGTEGFRTNPPAIAADRVAAEAMPDDPPPSNILEFRLRAT